MTALMSPISPPNTSSGWEFITPAKAGEYIGHNLVNRNLSKELVASYATDMADGRWRPNPNAGVMFSSAGDLLDGQHRLHAIVQAETMNPEFKGVWLQVSRNVESDVRPVIDIGRIRSLGDVLAMENKSRGTLVGAASQVVMNYLDGQKLISRRTKPEKYDFIQSNPDLFQAAELAASAGKGARPSALAAVLFLGTRADPERLWPLADAFARGLGDGASLAFGDPRLALRNAMLNERGKSKGGGASTPWAFSATVHSWNAWLANVTQATVRVVRGESGEYTFPPILGAAAPGAGVESVDTATLPKRAEETVKARENAVARTRASDYGDAGVSAK
jgi:hypothetical protein